MTLRCPRCGQKNRLPDSLSAGGVFVCEKCKEELRVPATAGRGKKRVRSLHLGRLPVWLIALTAPYFLVLFGLTMMNLVGPERWWFTSFNLYMPQWIWALPAIPLFLLFLIGAWRWSWLPVLLGLWVIGPLMGLQWHPFPAAAGDRLTLRVMTYNVKWGRRNGPELASEILRVRPDVIQMQDSGGVMERALNEALRGWNVRISGQYIVASRLPLSELESVDIGWPDSEHHAVRSRLTVGSQEVTLVNVHFLSPRYGLMSVRHREVENMQINAERRLIESQRLAEAISKEGPLLVTGDLNAPDQSLVCRNLFATGLRDAFSHVGNGYGYTYGRFTKARHSYVRIDHILYSRHFTPLRCEPGTDAASDHRPVIADFALSKAGK